MLLLGKPLLEYTTSTNGTPDDTGWTAIDTPKDGTTSINTTEGSDIEATEEGGEVVEKIAQSSKYAVTFELFKKAGTAFPLAASDNAGVVSGEYALRVRSAINSTDPGFQIDRATIKTSRQYSSGDGYRKAYTFSALKPNSGDTIKDIEGALLSFNATADPTGKTVTLPETGMVLTIPTASSGWFDSGTEISGSTLTVKTKVNSGAARETILICRGAQNIVLVTFKQAAGN